LDQAAREAFVTEGYRRGRLTLGEVAEALGLETRIEAQAWLARHGTPLNYDLDAIHQDRKTLGRLFQADL
jgi:predicted HTH domain antitoxin